MGKYSGIIWEIMGIVWECMGYNASPGVNYNDLTVLPQPGIMV